MTDLSSSSPRTSPAAQHPVQRARATLHAEVGKHYVGSRDTVDLLLVALLARGHILLEGVPGIAKTTLVKTFTETLGCAFSRIQLSAASTVCWPTMPRSS